jgi:hypothetical protein
VTAAGAKAAHSSRRGIKWLALGVVLCALLAALLGRALRQAVGSPLEGRRPAQAKAATPRFVSFAPASALEGAASGEGTVVPTTYRSPDEWQGLQVDTSDPQFCVDSRGCGLALSCRGSACGPCQRDGDCAAGEVCVLDHCLLPALVTCRSRKDCPGEALCFLSDYSPGLRGNASMRSRCVGDEPTNARSEPAGTSEPTDPALRQTQTAPFAKRLSETL